MKVVHNGMVVRDDREVSDLFEEYIVCLTQWIDDLAWQTVGYFQSQRALAAAIARDWSASRNESSPFPRDAERASLVEDSLVMREALADLANGIERKFDYKLIDELSRDPYILELLLAERAICSELCSKVVSRWRPLTAQIEAGRLPSAKQVDEILAHGTKLNALFKRGNQSMKDRVKS